MTLGEFGKSCEKECNLFRMCGFTVIWIEIRDCGDLYRKRKEYDR